MSKAKFPKLIHVTREKPENEEPFLIVHANGISTVDEPQPCAIYKLVKVGRITVTQKFVP